IPAAAHTAPPTEAGAPLPKVQDSPTVPQRSWRSRLDPASCGQTRAAARGGGGRARRFQGMSWVEWVEPWASVLACCCYPRELRDHCPNEKVRNFMLRGELHDVRQSS